MCCAVTQDSVSRMYGTTSHLPPVHYTLRTNTFFFCCDISYNLTQGPCPCCRRWCRSAGAVPKPNPVSEVRKREQQLRASGASGQDRLQSEICTVWDKCSCHTVPRWLSSGQVHIVLLVCRDQHSQRQPASPAAVQSRAQNRRQQRCANNRTPVGFRT